MAKSAPQKTVTKKTSSMKESKTKSVKTIKALKKLRPLAVKHSPLNFFVKLLLIIALGSGLFLVAQKYRGHFLAGTVNSVPVTRYELNQKMAEKYGQQTFDEIVSERLLNAEIKKNKIVVTEEEVASEMTKIVKDYGSDEAFKAALAQYNLTEDKARESIKQSLSLKRLIETVYKIEISDEAIKKYFDDNKTQYSDKKLEDVSAEIKETLYQQEIYTKTQEWFTGIRKSAKVVGFI
jgi:foldase protein PrsA